MRAKDVSIGQSYVAKVSGRLVNVRITREANGFCDREGRCRFGGWHAVSLEPGREVRIKTAARLRGSAEESKLVNA